MDWKLKVTMSILPKFVHRFNAFLINIPAVFFIETDKLILNLYEMQIILKTKGKSGGIVLPASYYFPTKIERVKY